MLTRMRVLQEDEICFTSWAPSLNDRSKLKGQYTDVKSGSGISVGSSLKPQSQLKQNSHDTVPLTQFQRKMFVLK